MSSLLFLLFAPLLVLAVAPTIGDGKWLKHSLLARLLAIRSPDTANKAGGPRAVRSPAPRRGQVSRRRS